MFILQIRINKFESVVMVINILIRDQRSHLRPCTAELANPGELRGSPQDVVYFISIDLDGTINCRTTKVCRCTDLCVINLSWNSHTSVIKINTDSDSLSSLLLLG